MLRDSVNLWNCLDGKIKAAKNHFLLKYFEDKITKQTQKTPNNTMLLLYAVASSNLLFTLSFSLIYIICKTIIEKSKGLAALQLYII